MLPGGPVVAILFFSHLFDRTSVAHLAKLREEAAGHGTVFVYADAHGELPPQRDCAVVTFDFDKIRPRYPSVLGHTLIPGNCHLTLLDFYRRHPEFDYYWVIEYDVAFTGHWGEFFTAFADVDADLIASHVRSYDEDPAWPWWGSLRSPDGAPGPRPSLVRAFCPIQRVSRRALQLLERRMQEGWSGHFETLVPTLLKREGHTLLDLGGTGSYVTPAFRNRFYRGFGWSDGRLRFGTMRYRPPFGSLRWPRKSTLYHPVKPTRSIGERIEHLSFVAGKILRLPARLARAVARR